MRKAISAIIGIMLLLAMCSCGDRFYLRKYERLKAKADKALAMAIARGAKVKTDTLYQSLKVEVPGINVSFPFKPVPRDVDTVYYDRDGVEVKIIYKRDQSGNVTAVKPIVKTETRYITKKVYYEVRTNVECNCKGKFNFRSAIIGASVISIILMLFFIKRKFF